MRKLTADFIHTGKDGFKEHRVLLLDSEGRVEALVPETAVDRNTVEYYPGILMPGFINAHCHLELSHLRNQFDTGTRLIPFLRNVVQSREWDPGLILEHIQDADMEMQREGIVAVGDISNKTDTLSTKEKSPIRYHTFVEAFDFLQDHMAQTFFASYKSVYDALGDLPKTMVPHAPYSVSKTLFRLLNETNKGKDSVTSIHNQETVDEDLLYQSGNGGFVEFWESFGFDMKHFQSTGEASVFYAMEHLDREHQVLFIHNTCMLEDHVRRTLQWNPRSFFVTCPNANLFIENHLPDYRNFLKAGARLCIGTDSLSSNWHLSILEEVKTILKYHSFLDLETVLGWATWNGASALKLDGLGAFQQGFSPGVNWIQSVRTDAGKCRLQPDARVRKIA